MSDDTTYTEVDEMDSTDMNATYTRIGSCAFGNSKVERRRQSLRARLEREAYERQKQLEHTFMSTFRNFFGSTKH
jgi:hypothetical protein